MMPARKASAEATFEDLSGVSTAVFSNPYDALISASEDDPVSACSSGSTIAVVLMFCQVQMQALYTLHRSTRNDQQKARMLDREFLGPNVDPILLRLNDPNIEPGFVDPRHCLVFWGRPSEKIKVLIERVQRELLKVAPSKLG